MGHSVKNCNNVRLYSDRIRHCGVVWQCVGVPVAVGVCDEHNRYETIRK